MRNQWLKKARDRAEELGLRVPVDAEFIFHFSSRAGLLEMLLFFEQYPKNRRSYVQQELPVRLFKPKMRRKVLEKLHEAASRAPQRLSKHDAKLVGDAVCYRWLPL